MDAISSDLRDNERARALIASGEGGAMDRLECDRMFVAVVEARSFTGAAVKLGTSSGQASKLVSRLEAELGVRLLNRTTRAVSETEAGRAYFERVCSILDEIDDLDLAIRNVAQSPRGRLRLTAPLTFGTVELARAQRLRCGLSRDRARRQLLRAWWTKASTWPCAWGARPTRV